MVSLSRWLVGQEWDKAGQKSWKVESRAKKMEQDLTICSTGSSFESSPSYSIRCVPRRHTLVLERIYQNAGALHAPSVSRQPVFPVNRPKSLSAEKEKSLFTNG